MPVQLNIQEPDAGIPLWTIDPGHCRRQTIAEPSFQRFHDSVLDELADRPTARDGGQIRLDRSPVWHSLPHAKKYAIT